MVEKGERPAARGGARADHLLGESLLADPKELRKRLAGLNREPLPERSGDAAEIEDIRRSVRRLGAEGRERASRPIVYHRDIPRQEAKPQHARPPSGPPVPLEAAVPGVETRSPGGGSAYLIEVQLGDIEEESKPTCDAFLHAISRSGSALRRRICRACAVESVLPKDVIFMDLETTGLSSTPLFLIGTMVWEGGDLVVRQYLARDYSEEPAAISLFLENAHRNKLLVSFNGKSFDMPYLQARAAANGIPFRAEFAHFDLLHECRRVWRNALPDCRLRTLESHVCRRERYGDIPSAEIPDAYHAFVRTGNAAQIAEILRHNMFDLVTLADLMVRLPEPGQP